MAVRIAGAALLVAALFAVGLVMTSGGNDEPEAQLASPTALAAIPTLPSPPTPGIPPRPTPVPGREGPETTLVDIATGRSERLWAPGTQVSLPQFTADGRWLVYGRGVDAASSSIFRVELSKMPWQPEELADGFDPEASSVGHLAFVEGWGTRNSVAIIGADGMKRDFTPPGTAFSFSWSPDGRWLTYSEPYAGQGNEMAIVLLDSLSWEARPIDYKLPCNCDSGVAATWSPDSSRFIYRDIESVDPRISVLKLAGTSGDPASILPSLSQFWWSADSRSVFDMRVPDGAPNSTWDLEQLDLATLERATLLSGLAGPLGKGSWSPDGRLVAVGVRGGGFPAVPTTQVRSRSGEIERTVAGFFDSWSPDGRFFLTRSSESCRGILVHAAATGELLHCLSNETSFFTAAAAFSPRGDILAYTQPRPLVDDPRIAHPPVAVDVHLLDLSTGLQRQLVADLRGYLSCLVWSPDGRYLVLGVCRGV